MDKYTYNIKAEKIQKLVKKGDYEAAVKIAETVDWEEVHSVRLLTITAAAYERIRDYKGAIELLQMAYDESAVGKRILYKLTGLAIADKDVELAQRYYEMYLQEAPDDNGRYLLRYLLAELKGESLDKRIAILETYRKYEFEEEWALRLAELYDEANMGDACVKICDEIILWFGVGEYVDEALKLKAKYAPLSAEQQDKIDNREFYEQRYQEVAAEYREMDEVAEEPEPEEEPAPEEAGEAEPESAPEEGEAPAAVLQDADAWRDRIILVEGDSLEKAVPKVLAALNSYHEKYGTAMTGLTRIPALKFNKLGVEASRPHFEAKDLLVDGAAALSDDLLNEIVAFVKEEGTTTAFALTDTPTELAYLDTRLGAFLKEVLPEIDEGAAEAEAEDLKLDVDAIMDEEPSADLAGDTKEIVPQVKAALGEAEEPVLDERAAVSDTVKFDKGAIAVETAGISAASVILPDNDDDYRQETIEDFFRAQDEAKENAEAAAEAAVKTAEEAAELPVQAAEEAKEAAEEVKEAAEEAVEEVKETAEAVPEAVAEAAEEAKEAAEEAVEEVKEAAEEAVEEAKEAAEEAVEDVKETAEEAAAAAAPVLEEAKEAAEEKAEELKEAAEEAAGEAAETVEEVKEAAEEKAEELKGAAEEAVGEAKEAAEDVKEEIKAEAGEIKEEAEAIRKEAEAIAEGAAEEENEAAEEIREAPQEIVTEKLGRVVEETDPEEALRRKAAKIPGSMSPESFLIYAKNYLTSIDCVLQEDGEEALKTAARARLEEGTALTKEEAENIIEAAADLSEKKGGLFNRRYNKEGCLILKSKFIV